MTDLLDTIAWVTIATFGIALAMQLHWQQAGRGRGR